MSVFRSGHFETDATLVLDTGTHTCQQSVCLIDMSWFCSVTVWFHIYFVIFFFFFKDKAAQINGEKVFTQSDADLCWSLHTWKKTWKIIFRLWNDITLLLMSSRPVITPPLQSFNSTCHDPVSFRWIKSSLLFYFSPWIPYFNIMLCRSKSGCQWHFRLTSTSLTSHFTMAAAV